jgi:DNA gyrase subunit A
MTNMNEMLPENTLKIDPDMLSYSEILIFTSLSNVFKIQNQGFNNLSQVISEAEFDDGEKPIYISGTKNYSGFLITAFQNGKIAKILMTSFQTEYARKKLKNCYNVESPLIYIELIKTDEDLVTFSSIKKVVLFNTHLINAVGSRTSKGVQVMKQKDGSLMTKVKRLEQVKFAEPEYYRKAEGLNVVGYYLKPEDEF